MKALTWRGKRDVRVDRVADPEILEPNDAIVRVTSTGICGEDLHLYEKVGPSPAKGDILGHEAMGEVAEVGLEIDGLLPGDRVVVPFQIACGACFMCVEGLPSQCETTQVRAAGMGAAQFGSTRLYGEVPGGQAEYLRVPQAQFGPIKVPQGPPDDRFVYLSDVLPTAWQAFEYAKVPAGGSLVVLGLGPIGDMVTRVAMQRGAGRVIGVDLVPERLERARRNGVEVLDLQAYDNVVEEIRARTDGRGPDAVIDAVGMEAHGAPFGMLAQQMTTLLPDPLADKLLANAGVDRLAALYLAIDIVRRGGTISLSGDYAGMADPLPMLKLFDKQLDLHMGHANVRRWVDDIMPLLTRDDDPLGTDTFATHHLPLDEGPRGYQMFQDKTNGTGKVLLHP